MTIRTKKIALSVSAGLLAAAAGAPALAFDNSHYGDTRINELPAKARIAHRPWVGSWWAYTRNGIAYRHKLGSFAECRGVDAKAEPKTLIDEGKSYCLSAAEKMDFILGTLDDIEFAKAIELGDKTQAELTSLQSQIRDLVRVLNKWIADNPGQDWRETDDGKEYLRLNEELETKKAELPQVAVDTATEFEHVEHGRGVAGVQGWWGHCNAWAAAALMEDEPRIDAEVTKDGRTITFTPGEVKALLTEAWMEHHSSFFGSRHNDPENEGVSWDDVTPAAFHIYTATQIGQQGKGFVIDRFTGDEVWNQPMRSYTSRFEPLYDADAPAAETVELKQTEYDVRGNAKVSSLGERAVYPVQVTTTIHWMTDGLPHEEHTVENIMADAYPTSFGELRGLWGEQVEMRTLTYTLYLDRPLADESARIIGDGLWDASLAGNDHAHPDFMWQPLAQTPSRRNYENPHLDYDFIENVVLPASQPTDDEMDTGSIEFTAADTPKDIPDNDANGVSSVIEVADGGRITSGTLELDLSHTYRGDLRVVVSKGGKSQVLHDRTGGSADDLKQTFDLTAFVGQDAAGSWTLRVTDHAGQDVGKINGWKLGFIVDGGMPVDPPSEAGEGTFEYAGGAIAIPDNDAEGISAEINVNQAGTVRKLEVTVDITHTYVGDLVIDLLHGGNSYRLKPLNEGGSTDDLQKTYVVEGAAGAELRGSWKLKVSDNYRRDTGTLNAVQLKASWN